MGFGVMAFTDFEIGVAITCIEVLQAEGEESGGKRGGRSRAVPVVHSAAAALDARACSCSRVQ